MTQSIKLISVSDIQMFRAISDNVPDSRLDPYILEAQEMDLYELLGKDLYLKLFTEVTPPTFPATYFYPELKQEYAGFLCYSAYARLISQNQTTVTAYGVVSKKTDFSDLVPEPTLQRTIQAARGSAQEYAKRLIAFLNDNSETYPEWMQSCNYRGRINKTGTAYLGAVKGNKSVFKRNLF
jgi:hypothetical protein